MALPTCPDCNARPIPTARSKRCLACQKKLGGNTWRQLLTRHKKKHGEKSARALAKAQGVPYTFTSAPADKRKPAKKKATKKAPAAPSAPPATTETGAAPAIVMPKDLELRDIGALGLEGLYITLKRYLAAIQADEISPGQLSQNIKPLYNIVADLAGGTTASHVEIVFQAAPETPKK